MAIKKLEMFHGAVLARLVRSERPTTLRMIETNLREAPSTYKVNDSVSLFVAYRNLRYRGKSKDKQSWTFQFQRDVLDYLAMEKCHAVLVCGVGELQGIPDAEMCLLNPAQLVSLYGLADIGADDSRSVTIRRESNRRLRVKSQQLGEQVLVPRSAIENWIIPGS